MLLIPAVQLQPDLLEHSLNSLDFNTTGISIRSTGLVSLVADGHKKWAGL